MSSILTFKKGNIMRKKNFYTIYCETLNIGKLLNEVNQDLNIGDEVELKVQSDKSITLYHGYFVYYGFKLKEIKELDGKRIIYIIKNKNIKSISDKKYSFFIKLPRTGKNGKRIFVYKLRTMQPYSEYIQDFVIEKNGLNNDGTIKDDFRITKIGKFLRRYWIDELPMLINFIKGDLKLVGVRPLSDSMLNKYPPEFVDYRKKCKPGLIPPYYIDKPNSFDGLINSERVYLQEYEKRGVITDMVYFAKFINALLFRGVRSS
jgi:lipopolysaccharide/colanic/teichoic acid biosynthesis glycosyltransferase